MLNMDLEFLDINLAWLHAKYGFATKLLDESITHSCENYGLQKYHI